MFFDLKNEGWGGVIESVSVFLDGAQIVCMNGAISSMPVNDDKKRVFIDLKKAWVNGWDRDFKTGVVAERSNIHPRCAPIEKGNLLGRFWRWDFEVEGAIKGSS